MDFSYESYMLLIDLLKKKKYEFCFYDNWQNKKKSVILRHDIDQSVDKAYKMACLENNIGVQGTYFVMISSDFYNVISKSNRDTLKEMYELGHEIGLHFDEENYAKKEVNIIDLVSREVDILTSILNIPIKTVSMHRPSKQTLDANYQFEKLINSYGKTFFCEFKYVSDSRMNWRENVFSVIKNNKYDKLHILTHPFWYSHEAGNIKGILKEFCEEAVNDRYSFLANNITNIESILNKNEFFRR